MRKALVLIIALGAMAFTSVMVAFRRRARDVDEQSQTVAETVRRVAKLTTVEMDVSDWRLRKDSKDLLGFIPVKCEKTVAAFFRGKVASAFVLAAHGAVTVEVPSVRPPRPVTVHLPAPRILYI